MKFQYRVSIWMKRCFGKAVSRDKTERNHRFLEEALELVQACDCTQEEAHKLVDYVYSRPVGEVEQEVGGVMVTPAALCSAQNVSIDFSAERELRRISNQQVVKKIRAKQASKPSMSPLPGVYPEREKF